MTLPPIVSVVATTFFPNELRAETFAETVATWEEHLHYVGNLKRLRLIIADDGSLINPRLRLPAIFKSHEMVVVGQSRHGVGASLNIGFQRAFEISPLVLYAVDDWCLIHNFDISPWVQLLMEREDVGMVRLGPPHPNTSGMIEAFTSNWQGWGLRLDRKGFAFGHRPALYHKRMLDIYGWFEEDVNAYECERLYNERFCSTAGPDIVLALPHPFKHLESIELAGVDPKEG